MNAETGDVQKFVEQGAVIEHCLVMYDNERMFPLKTLLDWINLIGPENTVAARRQGWVKPRTAASRAANRSGPETSSA